MLGLHVGNKAPQPATNRYTSVVAALSCTSRCSPRPSDAALASEDALPAKPSSEDALPASPSGEPASEALPAQPSDMLSQERIGREHTTQLIRTKTLLLRLLLHQLHASAEAPCFSSMLQLQAAFFYSRVITCKKTRNTQHTTQNTTHITQHNEHATRTTGHKKDRTTQDAEHLSTQRKN